MKLPYNLRRDLKRRGSFKLMLSASYLQAVSYSHTVRQSYLPICAKIKMGGLALILEIEVFKNCQSGRKIKKRT